MTSEAHKKRSAELLQYLQMALGRYGRGETVDHAIAAGHVVAAAVALHAHEAGAEAAARACSTATAEAFASERRKP